MMVMMVMTMMMMMRMSQATNNVEDYGHSTHLLGATTLRSYFLLRKSSIIIIIVVIITMIRKAQLRIALYDQIVFVILIFDILIYARNQERVGHQVLGGYPVRTGEDRKLDGGVHILSDYK